MNTKPNFTNKCDLLWQEMKDSVQDAINIFGRERVLKALEDSRFIVLNGTAIEFQGTMDDVASELDSLYADLSESV